ncbi:MAG TPA: hypothetical protein P5318_15300 [Candidatus Hydrogenedentes bacterium]|nr:hypothetical protein [Candidatus Hydrogenedentota bacterium]
MGFGLKDQHIVTRHCPAIPGIDADFGLKGQHIKAQGNALGRERILPSPALKGRDIGVLGKMYRATCALKGRDIGVLGKMYRATCALKGRDIVAQGNALGNGNPSPSCALKGRDIVAQGNALGRERILPSPALKGRDIGVLGKMYRATCALKGRDNESIPHISFIVFDSVSFQKQTKFVLKRHRAMMRLLINDVLPHP